LFILTAVADEKYSIHGGKKNSTIDNENETQKYFLVFASFFSLFLLKHKKRLLKKSESNKTEDGVIPGNSFQNTEELPKQLIKYTISPQNKSLRIACG
jgi:DNA relaxase NicK